MEEDVYQSYFDGICPQRISKTINFQTYLHYIYMQRNTSSPKIERSQIIDIYY